MKIKYPPACLQNCCTAKLRIETSICFPSTQDRSENGGGFIADWTVLKDFFRGESFVLQMLRIRCVCECDAFVPDWCAIRQLLIFPGLQALFFFASNQSQFAYSEK